MNSRLSWLDHSETERRRMLDVIDLFNDKNTVDELGIGTVRDALADLLFPGLSTIQTRARYYLFVPWVYTRLESQRVPSNEVAAQARKLEVQLIDALADSEDTAGVIGIDSRAKLKRLPSNVYWVGLATYRIRLNAYSQERYHNSLDSYYRSAKSLRTDDKEPVDGHSHLNWDPGLPATPADFPKKASLELSSKEADYLSERIQTHAHGSLWAFLISNAEEVKPTNFVWESTETQGIGATLRRQLNHARLFSEIMHGASLLYNLMLSLACGDTELSDRYKKLLYQWTESTSEKHADFKNWDRADFWLTVRAVNPRISISTQHFIESWIGLTLTSNLDGLPQNLVAQDLIRERETRLKRGLARFTNSRSLELWKGASGAFQLNYRWNIAQQILSDIQVGRTGESNA